MTPPGAFIPAAERFNLMASIDRWVINEALINFGARIAAVEGLSIGINLSGNSLNDPLFLPYLLDRIEHSPLRPERLYFELTETALMNQLSVASRIVAKLRDLGCKVALDDFGSGLSSFNYLKNFVVDVIKIDGSFVRNLDKSPVDQAIVDSINQIAHRLGAVTVAEFVEPGNPRSPGAPRGGFRPGLRGRAAAAVRHGARPTAQRASSPGAGLSFRLPPGAGTRRG